MAAVERMLEKKLGRSSEQLQELRNTFNEIVGDHVAAMTANSRVACESIDSRPLSKTLWQSTLVRVCLTTAAATLEVVLREMEPDHQRITLRALSDSFNSSHKRTLIRLKLSLKGDQQ